MPTTLLLATHRPHPHWQRAVPPAMRPADIATVSWQLVPGGFHWQQTIAPETLIDLYEILPCLSLQSQHPWGYQCTLEYITESGPNQSSRLAPIGAFTDGHNEQIDGPVRAEVDIWRIDAPLSHATLHWHLQCPTPPTDISALLSVSLRQRGELAVPMRSQMPLRGDLASHVCSPTSVSMLLDFYKKKSDIYDIIGAAQHQPSALYGVWPANIYAAVRHGLMGYLLHFPDWDTARHLLDNGLPIIASVRYKEGELNDAAIARTRGHLVVVRGYAGDKVFVNDPAAKTDAEVARAYDLREFCEVWLARSAVGYVLFAES
jgi:hypothetical protein